VDSIVQGDCRDPANYPKDIALTITSPPYFVGKEYEKDYSFDDYMGLLEDMCRNTARNTIDGGKIAINIADIAAWAKFNEGRIEENIDVIRDIKNFFKKEDCHVLARYIWYKDDPWVNSNHVVYHDNWPATYVRALPNWEYITVFYKGDSPKREGVPPITDVISKEDWKKWVSAVWRINSVRSNDCHEAMFPEELARRLVLLYSLPGDVVFDPFMGSGTTAVVAYKNGRNYAGIEREEKYIDLIQKNLQAVENSLERLYVPPQRFQQERLDFKKSK